MEGDDPKRRRIDQSGYQVDPQASQQPDPRASLNANLEQNPFPNQPPQPFQTGLTYGLEGHHFSPQSYQPGALPYNVDYGQAGGQHMQQGYAAPYGPSSTYSFTPPQGYEAQFYEAVQRGQHVLPGQYGVPPQSYLSTQAGQASGHAPNIPPTQPFAEGQAGQRPYIASEYSPLAVANVGPATQDIMEHDSTKPGIAQLNNTFQWYHVHLRQAFEDLGDSKVREASKSLLIVTTWLLKNVEALGLASDSLWNRPEKTETDEMKDWRLQLWRNFNHCWLGILQKQKEISQEELNSGQKHNRISRDELENMGNELVGWCELIQEHGLVDYEVGVWEDQIIDLLNPCCEIAIKIEGEPKPSSDQGTTRGFKRRR